MTDYDRETAERDKKYLDYVIRHRHFVLEEAIKLGIRDRGLVHDASKLSSVEFEPYAEYFYGGHDREHVPAHVRLRFNMAWNRHQKDPANDHHWQSWVVLEDSGLIAALPMSEGARLEMLADWRGAGRAIFGDKADTLDWYLKNRRNQFMHTETRQWIEAMLGVPGGLRWDDMAWSERPGGG